MSDSTRLDTAGTMPEWARSTFREFLDYAMVLQEVLELTIAGISLIRATPQAIRVLHDTGRPHEPDIELQITAAEHRAKLAQREVDSDFNIVHSQAVVALWSALEDVIRTFVARWLMNVPQTKSEPPWSELKIKLGEYESFDDEPKSYYLVGLVEQNTGAPLKQGVTRFESLLEKLSLDGVLDERVRRKLFEMQQVRNVIAHRRGIADTRFARACPDLGVSPGQLVAVSHSMWHAYTQATHKYFLEIIFRTGEKFGDLTIRERSDRAANPKYGKTDDTEIGT